MRRTLLFVALVAILLLVLLCPVLLQAAETEQARCKVHHALLQKDKVRMTYGLLVHTKEEWEAREKLFPNANREVNGGCLLSDIKEVEVLYCPKCREAEDKWIKARPKK